MRIAEIITAELAKETLILEEKLENNINRQDLDIEMKVNLIKGILKDMVLTESMYAKWYNIIKKSQEGVQNSPEQTNDEK